MSVPMPMILVADGSFSVTGSRVSVLRYDWNPFCFFFSLSLCACACVCMCVKSSIVLRAFMCLGARVDGPLDGYSVHAATRANNLQKTRDVHVDIYSFYKVQTMYSLCVCLSVPVSRGFHNGL